MTEKAETIEAVHTHTHTCRLDVYLSWDKMNINLKARVY